jgi:hypothetical protein
MSKSSRKGGAPSAEVEALRGALEKIQREASKRFEGQSCPRCLAIEALAVEALRSTERDDTSEINVHELKELLDRKRK